MDEEKLSLEDLEKMEEVPIDITEQAFTVTEGLCPSCHSKLSPVVDNKSLFDGSLTFHIIKLRCDRCKKAYLDLEQAQKYDLYLALEQRAQEEKSLESLQQCLTNGRIKASV